MLMTTLTMLILSGPINRPVEMKRCITGCLRGVEYGVDVVHCWYDEQVKCGRFQVECRDEGEVVCKPRSVTIGESDMWLKPGSSLVAP